MTHLDSKGRPNIKPMTLEVKTPFLLWSFPLDDELWTHVVRYKARIFDEATLR